MRLLQLKTVLVADDLTATSEPALRTAAALREGAGASLHVVHVAAPTTAMAAKNGIRAEFMQGIRESAARALGEDDYTPHVLSGAVPEAIGTLADRISADVVITGRRAHGALPMDRPLGGTAFGIITRSLMPCLVVTRAMTLPMKRVLVATDCSEASRGALVVGLSWASALRDRAGNAPRLTALHVHVDDDSAERAPSKRTLDHELDILKRAAGEWAGVDVNGTTVPASDAVSAIAEHARSISAELVVLGTRGANAETGGRLGSVSAAVMARLGVPVLLVPPAVWRDFARDLDF
jgi:nucleotide-binding universal stress UspA family protein